MQRRTPGNRPPCSPPSCGRRLRRQEVQVECITEGTGGGTAMGVWPPGASGTQPRPPLTSEPGGSFSVLLLPLKLETCVSPHVFLPWQAPLGSLPNPVSVPPSHCELRWTEPDSPRVQEALPGKSNRRRPSGRCDCSEATEKPQPLRSPPTGTKDSTLRPSLGVAPEEMWRCGIPGDLALALWGNGRVRGGGGQWVLVASKGKRGPRHGRPLLPGAPWRAAGGFRGTARPPPILESAEAPATQSEGGDTLSQGKALHLRLVGPLWDSQWVG